MTIERAKENSRRKYNDIKQGVYDSSSILMSKSNSLEHGIPIKGAIKFATTTQGTRKNSHQSPVIKVQKDMVTKKA